MSKLLDNVFWHALSGPQAAHAAWVGDGATVRRYAPGYSPIVAFADPAAPDFEALAALCAPGEAVYVADWSGPVPAGWRLDVETTMQRMVWDAGVPPAGDALGIVQLSPEDAPRAVALATLTRPGPFGPRTPELGDYFGVFDGPDLVAMAGERAQAGTLREVSGVCTHPAHQGKGWARKLMLHVMRRMVDRGETPFLHVMTANTAAHQLYLRMGFRDHAQPTVRVIAKA